MNSPNQSVQPSSAAYAGPEQPLVSSMFERTPLLGLGLSVAVATIFLGKFLFGGGGGGGKKLAFPLVKKDGDGYNFLSDALKMVEKGRSQHPGMPFFIEGENGPLAIIPPNMIDDIRSHEDLSFHLTVREDFHDGMPGFEAFTITSRGGGVLQTVISKQLTKYVGVILNNLSDEAAYALHKNFGDDTEWREHPIKPIILDTISRVASRIFLGEDLCRNEEWLELSKGYTIAAFMAARDLRQRPFHLRRLMQWFEPSCKTLRRYRDSSRALILPIVDKRRALRRECIAQGKAPPVFNDCIDWFEEEAAGRDYDAGMIQQAIAATGNHTSSDFTTKFVLILAEHPEVQQEIREEIVRVLGAEGLTKAALANLKLLDSAMKETQRLQPLTTSPMARMATKDIHLANGVCIPKGTPLVIDGSWRLSPDVYENPLEFDAHRFLKWRGTDRENMAHFVSTAASHTGFGHGIYACPGRFFATNELKVILCQLILKYDWKLAEGSTAEPLVFGFNLDASWDAKIMVRRRKVVELDIDALSA
ncbi:hypothetical protein MCOR08_002176 [Pyricularia oryzae]|nr:hypothetical protein MCOR01_003390 [Pyricularia oryzae]KAI6639339.1 hypothetical protein MCOR08_002176 [Pyricularia oryzae]